MKRLEELFHAALELPAGERAGFLDRECADSPELGRRLEEMLAHAEDDRTLEPPYPTPPVAEGPGAEIGPYKLLERIGEGGFGVVYMAEQRRPVRRRVALKLIKAGMDTREVVARFEAERQALALMDHPSIARVLDAGATPSGRPFFVMELVRGEAVTEYCDRRQLGVRERTELFTGVCLAVQHAHQKGIVHRDLKPSNVLVSDADGRPLPKIIDFGIAKAIDLRLTEKTLFTSFRQFLGTPLYMSPEQASATAGDVDTRSDIYSLGVLLYELLTGSTPFATETLWKGGLSGIERMLREVEPPRPSVRISTAGDRRVAERRRQDVTALSRRLSGDLDWVVMKALAKERDRRYPSASELAADLGRHLAHQPVLAGAPGAGYRLRKFLRRHRAAVISAALVAQALLAGLTAAAWGFWEASRQRESARQEASRARQVTDFLVATLELTDPEVAQRGDLTVSRLLDTIAQRLDDAFTDDELSQARVRTTVGRAYASLGAHELAESHLRRAVTLYESHTEADAGEHYGALWSLTHVAFQLDRGDCYELAHRARLVGLGHVAASHPELAESLESFYAAAFEAALGTEPKQPRHLEELFDAARGASQELGLQDPLWLIAADTYEAAGLVFWYQSASEPLFREALEIRRRELGPGHPEVGKTLGHLVRVLSRSGQYSAAEALCREALVVLVSVAEEGYFQLAFVQSLLGEALTGQGRYAEAEPLLLESHAVILETVGSEDRFFAIDSFARVATLYGAWGREEQATPYRDVLARVGASYKWPMPWPLARLAFGAEHSALVERLEVLHQRPGDDGHDLAPLVEEVVVLRRSLLPPREPLSALLGRLFSALVEAWPPDASGEARRRLAQEAVALLEAWRSQMPLVAAEALAALSEIDLEAGQAVRAAESVREAWELVQKSTTADHWIEVGSRVRVGRALLAQGLWQEAETLLRPGYDALATQLGEGHSDVVAVRALLVKLNADRDRSNQAADRSNRR